MEGRGRGDRMRGAQPADPQGQVLRNVIHGVQAGGPQGQVVRNVIHGVQAEGPQGQVPGIGSG